ncbi:TSC22 domain family protein 4 [Alligator sinensis]|uniref:TSC22 domain family protein 4 n=1 Tax=Alligator sinensis TaxID=38654 RepID=A0A1U7SVE8_ALLSI|nr:TSC22 domain family protein 4 [Alligator sinensis]
MSRKKSGFQITGVSGEAALPPGPGSRFRVVRLGVGTGEPYRRGRWTCRDCYEVPVPPVPSHPSLALRLPHSLDATRAHPGTPSAPQARSLGGPSAAALPSTTRLIQQQELPLSRPASPAPPEGGPSQMVPDPLSLAHSMLALDEDSAGSGVIAIDNKIEQAMDLVKSHLLLAVREEVELLREQIRELAECGVALERENALLRALATPAQLAQLRPPASPGGGE